MAINLPRFYSTKELPGKSGLVPVSPGMASKPYEALAGAGQDVEKLGLHAANVFYQMSEKEKAEKEKVKKETQRKERVATKEKEIIDKAAEAVMADKVGHEIDDEYEQKSFSYGEREDQGNLEKDAQTFNKTAMAKWSSDPRIAGNPRLTAVIEKHVRDKAANLVTGTRRQRAIIINKEGDAEWERDKNEGFKTWAETIDPVEKDIAKTKLATKGEIFVGRGIIFRDKYEADMRNFDKNAKAVASDLADVNADKAIMANPGKAFTNLQDPKYLPDLFPKQRQNKVEKALTKFNIANKKEDEGGEEDQTLKSKLVAGLYGSKITVSEMDLNRALETKKINIKTYKEYLAHRTSRVESLETKEKSSLDRAFEHNEKVLGMKFTMEGPGAAIIDREAKSLHAEALREYYGLVHDPKNPMEPDQAFDKVWNRYEQVLEGVKDRESKKLRKALVIPNKKTSSLQDMGIWLTANEKNMPKATFETQIRMLRSIDYLERSQQKTKELKSTQPQIEKGKYPVKKVK